MTRHLLISAFAGLVLSVSAMAADKPAEVPAYIAAAVADAARPAADKERDGDRKPADMLMFAGIKPGTKVLEIEPGGGYFTRLFAKAVGPEGHVYSVYGAPPPEDADQRFKDMMAARQKTMTDLAAAYGNITPIGESYGDFKVPELADVAWTSQNYHDFHLPRFGLDIAKFNKAVFDSLKPGGLFIVLDHSAAEGAGVAAADSLHRMDEAVAKMELEAAGFKLVAESDALRNPNDARTAMVFDPSIRGKTDQFILAFQKPAAKQAQ